VASANNSKSSATSAYSNSTPPAPTACGSEASAGAAAFGLQAAGFDLPPVKVPPQEHLLFLAVDPSKRLCYGSPLIYVATQFYSIGNNFA